MGTRHTKGSVPEPGPSPQHGAWKRTPSKERGDIFASLVLKSGDRFGRHAPPPPYQRRVVMIQQMMAMAKEGKQDEATELLKTLRQDLGMESTSLDDVLYRYASFRNLVDPITHDLIISLARHVHCPKTEGDALSSMEKVCRQLTYHLSPHSQWRRQGLLKRKPQACLKAVLSTPPLGGTVDLSGIPLSARDVERLRAHLQRHTTRVQNLEMGFTELTDEALLQLLPCLAALPHLETLALNGNRLTRAVLPELTDALRDPSRFPSVTWIDLGNNVDIFSLPQPFLVGLRKRCPKQGNLPTILEFGESQASELEGAGTGSLKGMEAAGSINLVAQDKAKAKIQMISDMQGGDSSLGQKTGEGQGKAEGKGKEKRPAQLKISRQSQQPSGSNDPEEDEMEDWLKAVASGDPLSAPEGRTKFRTKTQKWLGEECRQQSLWD